MRHLLSATAILGLGLSGAAIAQANDNDPTLDPGATPPAAVEPMTPPANAPEGEMVAPIAPAEDIAVDSTTVAPPVIGDQTDTLQALPGANVLASQVQGLKLWTTEQPAGSPWDGVATLTERPAEWESIGGIEDIVLTASGEVQGYVADVGGFLGMGSKRVLLEPAQLRLMHNGTEAYFATHFTADELKALPDFQSPALVSGM